MNRDLRTCVMISNITAHGTGIIKGKIELRTKNIQEIKLNILQIWWNNYNERNKELHGYQVEKGKRSLKLCVSHSNGWKTNTKNRSWK